jgi:hypothetical protein
VAAPVDEDADLAVQIGADLAQRLGQLDRRDLVARDLSPVDPL